MGERGHLKMRGTATCCCEREGGEALESKGVVWIGFVTPIPSWKWQEGLPESWVGE
jgi:hypothetical protein